MSLIWSEETQQEFEREFWQTKDRWQNQNSRFHEEHDDDGLGLFRAMLIAVPVGAVSLYFVGWWVIPFFRALWRAR